MQRTVRGVLTVALLLAVSLAFGQTQIVRAADFDVTNINDEGSGSLRAAIELANATPGPDSINFRIPGGGPHVINLLTPLPIITGPVTITGETEEGWVAAGTTTPADIRVEINGGNIGGTSTGLTFGPGSGGSVVRGVAINRFTIGIDFQSSNNTVRGSIIGHSYNGTVTPGSMQTGVQIINSSGNTVGGTVVSARNVISGMDTYGVYISGAGATNNRVSGNYIGTDSNGTAAVNRTATAGIFVENAPNTLIGGAGAARNVIAGNTGNGINVSGASATNTQIQGNYIGVDRTGNAALSNAIGVYVLNAPGTTIGGSTIGLGNIISGNLQDGIRVQGTTNPATTIRGNSIGVGLSGVTDLGNGTNGIYILNSGNNVIGGTTLEERNIISGNNGSGVTIQGAASSNTTLQGNYIGVGTSGTEDLGNSVNGVSLVSVNGMTIGGTASGAGNVISGNDNAGIYLNVSSLINIQGNTVGLNASGNAALSNNQGIVLQDSSDNTIGGTASGARNLVSGNVAEGIVVRGASSSANVIQGNYVGLNAGGTIDLGNGGVGINIFDAPANTIGGTAAGARNVISGNNGGGISIGYTLGSGASVGENRIEGNYIGTNATGSQAVSNTGAGIIIGQPDTIVGGTSAAARNVISGNTGNGITITNIGVTVSNNIIRGNYIGVAADGTTALPNNGHGIQIDNYNNTIGGTPASAANIIANNGGAGVTFASTETRTGSSIRANSIYNNGGLGIDLPPVGITPNDDKDTDTGANNLQNYPVLSGATQTPSNYLMSGTLNSTPLTAGFIIEFFAGDNCPAPGGEMEGRVYLGNTVVTTNAEGNATFTDVPVTAQPALRWVVATATSPTGNTSEFSACVRVNNRPTITALNDIVTGVDIPVVINFTIGDFETPVGDLLIEFASSNPAVVPLTNISLGGSGANRSATITPADGMNGVTTISVIVTDADGASVVEDFVLTVSTPPTISDIPDQGTASGVPVGPINFTVNDAETPPADLTLSATSSNPALVPVSNIVFGGTGANRTVTVTPVAGQFGSATITVTVSDGFLTGEDDFELVVGAAPIITPDIPNQYTSGTTPVGPIAFSVSDADSVADDIVITATSSNTALVPNGPPNLVLGGTGLNRTITVVPVQGQVGTTTITITATDETNGKATEVFDVIVNSPPTISPIPDQVSANGAPTPPIPFVIGDLETPPANLLLSAASSNTTLVPVANISFGGIGPNRTVIVDPVDGISGQSTITVTVTDQDGGTASASFVISVSAPPVITPDIPNQTILVNGVLGPINFTITDETPANVQVTGTSSNQAVVINNKISFGGSGANRTVTVIPELGVNGTTTITITATDPSGLTDTEEFVLIVNARPVITAISNQLTPVNVPLSNLQFTIGDLETPAANLAVVATSSVQSIVPNANISISGTGATRSLSIIPATNAIGTTVITITVTDLNGGTASASFDLNVFPSGGTQIISNGNFSSPIGSITKNWAVYGAPTVSAIQWRLNSGVMEFYRNNGTQQAVLIQNTQTPLVNGTPLVARLDLANSSAIRKRVLVLLHDADFSDTLACSFWLEPNTPNLRTYRMHARITESWSEATMSIYASSADSAGYIRLDNVELYQVPGLTLNETLCFEPSVPTGVGSDGPNIVQNSGFTTAGSQIPAPWIKYAAPNPATSGVFRVQNNVAEFYRVPGSTSAVIFQNTGVSFPANSIIEARFDLGNNSGIRKRATILLHNSDFTDLAVCSFWLNPNTPMTTFVMRTYNGIAWPNASVSVYVAPGDNQGWLRLDNVQMLLRPTKTIIGTECLLPGSSYVGEDGLEAFIPAEAIPTLEPTATPALPIGEMPIIATPAPFEGQAPSQSGEGLLTEEETTGGE